MKRTPLRIFDRYMTVDLAQRFIDVHDMTAKHYQAVAQRTGIETFEALAQQELKLVGLYKEMGEEMQKQRRNKMRNWILIGVVVMMLVLAGNVGAQDEPSPLTPQGEGDNAIVIEPGSGYSALFVGALVIFTIGSGAIVAVQQRNIGRLLTATEATLKNKQVQDEAERRYMESSLSVQQTINLLRAIVQFGGSMNLPGVDTLVDEAGNFLGNISDGKPNLTAEDIAAIRRRAIPPSFYTGGRDVPPDAEGG